MTLEKFSSGNNGTRAIEAGDVPDWMDYFAVSYPVKSATILTKGNKCLVVGGFVENATGAKRHFPICPCVPTQSVDNQAGANGDQNVRIMLPGQMVALKGESIFTLGQYGTIAVTTNFLEGLSETLDNSNNDGTGPLTGRKYARYVGKEGAIFTRSALAAEAYIEELSPGINPDQDLALNEIGWFQLVESAY